MKKIVTFILLLTVIKANAQFTCCSVKSPLMSSANDAAFKATHESPLPFQYDSKGEMIKITAADGSTVNAYKLMDSKPTDKWLFVFHEWWGLNDYIKQRTDELQNEFGVNVLALDMYDGKVATNPDEAGKLMSGLKDERTNVIISTAYIYAGKKAKVATIGWCMGGVMSVKAALKGETNCIGCVTYYGLPDVSADDLKKLNCSIEGLFAKKDAWINTAFVEGFEKKMTEAGKKIDSHWYDADHAFANPSNPHYDKEAAAQANAIAIEYLKNVFGM